MGNETTTAFFMKNEITLADAELLLAHIEDDHIIVVGASVSPQARTVLLSRGADMHELSEEQFDDFAAYLEKRGHPPKEILLSKTKV